MNTFKLDGIWDFYFDAEGKTIADTLPEVNFDTALSVPGCYDVAAPFFGKRGVGYYRCITRTGGSIRLSAQLTCQRIEISARLNSVLC